MKHPKSKPDEMQEMLSAKVEHIGICGTAVALGLAIFTQMIMDAELKCILGEFIVLETLCVYMVAGRLKYGVWGRSGEPSIRSHLTGSLFAAALEFAFIYLTALVQGSADSIFGDALIFSGLAFALCFLMLTLVGFAYKKRRQKLDRDNAYRELAQAVGVRVQTLQAIENGTYNPSIKLCKAICRATGRTLDELFRGDQTTGKLL